MNFTTLSTSETEQVICRSRFIAFSFRIQSEDEAFEILKALSKKYSDATHICYAFVADILGNIARFSDDGEPSGTAGRPILDAIQKNSLRQTLIAVVRYFGGVKLGAGGLVRAYGGIAADLIDKSKKMSYGLCTVLRLTTDFASAEKLKRFLSTAGTTLATNYTDNVEITIAVQDQDTFLQELSERTGGSAQTQLVGEEYIQIEK